ncbi:MAG TPA: hypothetical protein VG845_09805 [Dehalococcoidia bacterium]|jgi:hypothetical protein|nr:hypothetical protein [Dehalococcoidia bacterium]
MVTITLRGIHLAIAGAFLAGILIAGGIVLAASGGDDAAPATANQQPSQDNVDVAPTSVPTAAASPTPLPPTAAPTVVPTPVPQVRSCAEIRATGIYNSDEERAFFLANCTTQPAAGGGGPVTPPVTAPGNSAEATAAEQEYRRLAEARLAFFIARLVQYYGQPSFGAINDILELGGIARSFANELNALQPVPPRFLQAHNQLRATLLTFSAHMITIQSVTTFPQFEQWVLRYDETARAVNGAITDYNLVTGLKLPVLQ